MGHSVSDVAARPILPKMRGHQKRQYSAQIGVLWGFSFRILRFSNFWPAEKYKKGLEMSQKLSEVIKPLRNSVFYVFWRSKTHFLENRPKKVT